MSRIKHPIRALEEPFGKAGLIVAVIALVLALTGAAFAAGALTSKQKKEVEKIAKKFAGKPGAPGAQGPAGPQGPAGSQGKEGPAGKEGSAGKEGPTGPTGQTGFTETLPSEKTETGSWGVVGPAATTEHFPYVVPISFAIPLEVGAAVKGQFVEKGHPTGECPGSAAEPKAEPGFLCVYEGFAANVEPNPNFGVFANPAGGHFGPNEGVSPNGSVLALRAKEAGEAFGVGSWAVTAP